MPVRSELSIGAAHDGAACKPQESRGNLLFVALALVVLLLLAAASVSFVPEASDPLPADAQWLIGP